MIQRLVVVQRCIENKHRNHKEKKTLIDTFIEHKVIKRWLKENSDFEAFFKLLDLFHLLRKKLDKEEKKNHSNTVDITFVAHGSITGSVIPASCLLTLPAITDIILYSPWNCAITADAAYGVATGLMEPKHRGFCCIKKDDCKIPKQKHRPTKLPNEWNSMKKAGDRKIPNIMLGPLKQPKDDAWNRFEFLENTHGKPGRNRIVIPYTGKSKGAIPFFVVSLALSVVLSFSRFQATLHLVACLSKPKNEKMNLEEDALEEQYACTIAACHPANCSALSKLYLIRLPEFTLERISILCYHSYFSGFLLWSGRIWSECLSLF